MSITFAEVKNAVLNYEVAKRAQEKANEDFSVAMKALKNITGGTEMPTKAVYEKILAFATETSLIDGRNANTSLIDSNYSLKQWLKRMSVFYQKGVKYKGFEIKDNMSEDEDIYGKSYSIYKDGKGVYAFERESLRSVDDAKKAIDLYLEAMKKLPPLMNKLGLNKVSYVVKDKKRSVTYSEKRYFICEQKMLLLMKFLRTFPNVKNWKVEILHDQRNMSANVLKCAVSSETEYTLVEGDFVRITSSDKPLKDGGYSGGNEFHWGVTQH